jgi:hypothetical protein
MRRYESGITRNVGASITFQAFLPNATSGIDQD